MKTFIAVATALVVLTAGITATTAHVVTANAADAKLSRAVDNEQKAAAKRLATEKEKSRTNGYNVGFQDGKESATEDLAQSGYHDQDTLASSVKKKLNKSNKEDDSTYRVDSLGCVASNSKNTKFVCHAEWNDDSSDTIKVTVSPDGNTWVSEQS